MNLKLSFNAIYLFDWTRGLSTVTLETHCEVQLEIKGHIIRAGNYVYYHTSNSDF